MHRLMGQVHGTLAWAGGRLRGQAGQGTVEYVALILLVRSAATGQRRA